MRSSSSNMLQIPCKMTGFSYKMLQRHRTCQRRKIRQTCSCCVPHESFQTSHTHTEIRCFQLPRTRVKTPCPVDSRHFLRTSGTVSCKMLQIRYFSLNMASKSVQNTDSSSKMLQLRCSQKIQGSKRCKYRANRRFRVHNVANTEEIRDS